MRSGIVRARLQSPDVRGLQFTLELAHDRVADRSFVVGHSHTYDLRGTSHTPYMPKRCIYRRRSNVASAVLSWASCLCCESGN
jgi:hypothetical protein